MTISPSPFSLSTSTTPIFPSALSTLLNTHLPPPPFPPSPTPSPLPTNPSTTPSTPFPIPLPPPAHQHHALALETLHNLCHQHDWTALHLHTHSPLPPYALLPRPLISGVPPERIYVHPDEQVELLRGERGKEREGGREKLREKEGGRIKECEEKKEKEKEGGRRGGRAGGYEDTDGKEEAETGVVGAVGGSPLEPAFGRTSTTAMNPPKPISSSGSLRLQHQDQNRHQDQHFPAPVESSIPSSSTPVVEREWVLPTSLREKWSLRRFAEVFDAIGAVPPSSPPLSPPLPQSSSSSTTISARLSSTSTSAQLPSASASEHSERKQQDGGAEDGERERDKVGEGNGNTGEKDQGAAREGEESEGEKKAPSGKKNEKRKYGGKRVLMAIVGTDSTVVYYIVHEGVVKPRQN